VDYALVKLVGFERTKLPK